MELFGANEVRSYESTPNPMITAYGEGPEGARCRTCAHLVCKEYAKRYYKCKLRGTDGVRTDHNYYWPACSKYEIARGTK